MAGGCSKALSTDDPGDPPPHDGALIFLPGEGGIVEIVKKTGSEPMTAELYFYFYKDRNFNPFEPAPKTGVLVLADEQKIQLKADDDALVTPAGPALFADRPVDGVLSVELDGEKVNIPLGVR
jgi:hypothetical protein